MVDKTGRTRLRAALQKCVTNSAGVTAIEYALIASIIVIAVSALLDSIGNSLNQTLSTLAAHL